MSKYAYVQHVLIVTLTWCADLQTLIGEMKGEVFAINHRATW